MGKLLLTLCFVLLISQVLPLRIIAPEEIAGEEFLSPRQVLVGPRDWSFDFIGQLTTSNDTDPTNKIVMIRSSFGDQQTARDLQSKSPMAIISLQLAANVTYCGLAAYNWDGTDTTGINIPMVIISRPSTEKLWAHIEKYGNVTVQITSDDPNPWTEMFSSGAMIAFQVLQPIFIGLNIVYATYKQVRWVQVKGVERSVPQTVLWFELIANLLRFLAVIVDPIQSRVIFPVLLNQMLYTLSWPFSIMSFLLISFYWHELLRKIKIRMNKFLDKLRVVFWIIFGLLLALELATAIARGLAFAVGTFVLVSGIIYIVIVLATAVFFLTTGIRIMLILNKAKDVASAPEHRKKLVRSTTYLIFVSSSVLICWAIMVAVGGLTTLLWVPWGFYSIWFVVFTLLAVVSASQISAFAIPSTAKSSGSTLWSNP